MGGEGGGRFHFFLLVSLIEVFRVSVSFSLKGKKQVDTQTASVIPFDSSSFLLVTSCQLQFSHENIGEQNRKKGMDGKRRSFSCCNFLFPSSCLPFNRIVSSLTLTFTHTFSRRFLSKCVLVSKKGVSQRQPVRQ